MEKVLRGTRKFVSSDSMKTIVEYFSIQKEVDIELEGKKIVYGVEIVKSVVKDNVIFFDEYELIDVLTDSKELLNNILGKLIAKLVLPIELLYIIDDLMIEEPFMW